MPDMREIVCRRFVGQHGNIEIRRQPERQVPQYCWAAADRSEALIVDEQHPRTVSRDVAGAIH